ncbi:MAG TPA: Trk system potassium transporter TrkA [Candidatus Coprenecus stercoravium]|uniref:Trk system potassium uptake protein TrkA n=1 Tax=Candidatus Coprenecus stercoravium TaxID=2840735 RepID=A0A9D2GQ98_9BACT|nr:Trk system potassium transporter TrkA [Candidatus Coprenecus stercoravium]
MRIIVAGAGEIGSHLAKMLSMEFHEITVISQNEENLEKISSESDIVTVEGVSSSIDTLVKAGVQNADLFIAVNPDAEQDINIVSAVLAKKLGAKKVTARINNEEYQKNENRILFTDLGIDSLFYPEKIAATEIVNLLKQNTASEFMSYSHGKLQLIVYKLESCSPMVDRTVAELRESTQNLFRTVAISRGNKTIIPRSATRFKLGDIVYLVSKKEGMEQALSLSGKSKVAIKNLMILGGGRIGEMVAKAMERQAENIKLIELNPAKCEHLSEALNKTLVINGDGRNSDLLLEEGLKDMEAFVAVTSSSETNILSCVVAKRMGISKVIAEVENFEYIKLAEEMGVDSVINKKLITAGKIFRFTLSNKVRSIKVLNGTDAVMLEFIVNTNSKITTGKLKDLHFPDDAIIGGYVRGNESFIADRESTIRPYDQVVVFANPDAVDKVDKFFL